MTPKGQSTIFKVSVTILTVVFLAVLAVPHFQPPFRESQKNYCIGYLKQLDSAKEQWAMDNNKPAGTPVNFSDIVGLTLYLKFKPTCPNRGSYTLNRVGKNPTCTHPGDVLPQ